MMPEVEQKLIYRFGCLTYHMAPTIYPVESLIEHVVHQYNPTIPYFY